MLKYLFSEAADKDLDEIYDYTEDKYSQSQAIKYLLSLEEVFNLLANNPESGRSRNEIKSGLRSIYSGEHVVFYRIMKGHIRVVRVLHGSRDLPKFLE